MGIRALALAFLLAAGAVQASEEDAIRAVLAKQSAAWNRGDIPAFMDGYWQSEQLRFASGNRVTHGWQQTLKGYQQRYPDQATMGELRFDIREVRVLGERHALVFGHWQLQRQGDRPEGLFTLLMEKIRGDWKVVADHTSSAP
ncbi:SgcJ/EcaC family oxidoreductase [Gallaecimonas sp. GXIMD4217]|uniref:YybH family protein n=1 Tax=Gallaecimonas sp. GXIMD4217 TaxID=3131927 RepID=UPI00311B18A9